MANWISIENRLPEIGKTVLVRLIGQVIALGCLNEDYWDVQPMWDNYYRTKGLVTHWIHLPNLYLSEPKGKCLTGHIVKPRCTSCKNYERRTAMEVSQAAIDEVRAVRLADEIGQRRKKLAKLTRAVNCCASCNYWNKGWIPNTLCIKHEIDAESYLVCDNYERRIT